MPTHSARLLPLLLCAQPLRLAEGAGLDDDTPLNKRPKPVRQPPGDAGAPSPPGDGGCADDPEVAASCVQWAAAGECTANSVYMLAHCRAACGCPPPCEDRDKSGACAAWSAAGECDANPAFMKIKCAKSCGTCDMLDFAKRCPKPVNVTPAVPPGFMSSTFERAVSLYPEFEPQVLSRDPWVVSFDKFVEQDEIDALLRHGGDRFVRSTASGGRAGDEFVPLTSEIRTSYTTWCDSAACMEEPAVKRLSARMANVTQTPANNSEFIQLLRYSACPHARHPDCQFYRRHHDTIPELAGMPCGPRVYTFFLYLSDVEEGGGTKFDGGFTVQPKAGRAVLWPATYNERPFDKDGRTHHEALPVTRGTKYAANFWIHQYDYVSAHHAGCTA